MKSSSPQFVNKEALSIIYNTLAGGSNPPKIHDGGEMYWVTNGYVAFAFAKSEFIFNAELMKEIPLSGVLEGLERAIIPVIVESVACRNSVQVEKLVSKEAAVSPVFINKQYHDAFSEDCSLFSDGNLKTPIAVKSPYGDVVGVILPIALGGNHVW